MIAPVARVASSGGYSEQMQNYGTFRAVQHANNFANEKQEDFNEMMNVDQQSLQNQIYYEAPEIEPITEYMPPVVPIAAMQAKSGRNKVTPLTQSETSKHINIRV